MKALRFQKALWRASLGLAAFALLTLPAFAQCSMCRAGLETSNGAAMAKSLNLGIIVLLIPPVAIFCAIFITACKLRKSENTAAQDDWLKKL